MCLNCSERERLKKRYLKAVNAYGEAVNSAVHLSNSRAWRELTQQSAQACRVALEAFLDHVREHGCETSASLPGPM